jgi:catechol 2,3-dioxygenase-like lactoylglutathione lyase family enzyme
MKEYTGPLQSMTTSKRFNASPERVFDAWINPETGCKWLFTTKTSKTEYQLDVRYLVDDVDAALAFYTNHLGFTLEERWGPPFAMITKGDLRVWLSGPGTSAAKPMPDGRQPVPGGWNRLVIEVSDLEAVVSRTKQDGVQFRNEILSGSGGKQILADDPSGNPIELFEPLEQKG